MTIKGVQYVVNDKGNRTGVFIDLKMHQALWEDFLDAWVSRLRRKEPRLSLKSVRQHLGLHAKKA